MAGWRFSPSCGRASAQAARGAGGRESPLARTGERGCDCRRVLGRLLLKRITVVVEGGTTICALESRFVHGVKSHALYRECAGQVELEYEIKRVAQDVSASAWSA